MDESPPHDLRGWLQLALFVVLVLHAALQAAVAAAPMHAAA
jgi:hypothetical protein